HQGPRRNIVASKDRHQQHRKPTAIGLTGSAHRRRVPVHLGFVFVAEVSLNGHEHAAGEVNVALAWMPPELMFTDPFLHRLGFPIEISTRLDQDLPNWVRKGRHSRRSLAALYRYKIAR